MVLVALAGPEALQRVQGLFAALPDTDAAWERQRNPLTRHPDVAAALPAGGAGLDELLDRAATLALLRLGDGAYLVLRCRDRRWFFVDAAGDEVCEHPEFPAGMAAASVIDGLLLSFPDRSRELLDTFASLRRMLRPAWAEVGLASLIVNAGVLVLPLFAMLVYDKVAYNGAFSTLWALVIGIVLYLTLDVALRTIRAWAVERLTTELTQREDVDLWRTLGEQTEPPRGGLARFLTQYRDLTAAREFASSTFLLAIADMPFLVLYLVAIAIIAWPLLPVALGLLAVYAWIGARQHLALRQWHQDAEKAQIRKLGFFSDALATLDLQRLSPGTGLLERRWRTLCAEAARADTGRRLSAALGTTQIVAMSTVTSVAMLVAGVYLIDARMLTVGGLIAASLLAGRAMGILSSLFSVLTKMQDFRRAVTRIESSLEREAAVDGASPEREHVARPDITGRIQLISVSKYFPGRPPVLQDISLTVAPGERVALLGRPGAGKSTLLRCLARLARVDGGQILFDGVNVNDIRREDMRRWLAYKAQEPALFAGMLEENIRIALPRGLSDTPARRRRLEQALWASGLDEEFRRGQMSLGMVLDEQGRNLSGGQRQKVALARALAQESRVLLLDEPSLGLDPDAEKALAERIPQVMASEDVLIVVSHSATMLASTGRVIVLDGGRVVADGDRERLVRVAPPAV